MQSQLLHGHSEPAPSMIRSRGVAPEPALWTAYAETPRHDLAARPAARQGSRMLLVCAPGFTPRDISTTWRLLGIARKAFELAHVQTEVLDLDRMSPAELGRWDTELNRLTPLPEPHAAGPGEVGACRTAAHGVLVLMPARWGQTSSVLQMLINRSASMAAGVAAAGWQDGPNGWDMGVQAYGLVMQGDLRHASRARHALFDWLDWMGLVEACEQARLAHVIGPCERPGDLHPAPAHDDLLESDVRAATAALLLALAEIEAGRLYAPEHVLMRAWPR